MTKDEESLKITLIEYTKEMEPGSELLPIFRHSLVRFEHTTKFTGWTHPNQYAVNVELRVPIPLLKEAGNHKNQIIRIASKCYQENDQYGFGTVELRPKLIGLDEVEYKEHSVCFENNENVIIQAIRDAKYTIWIAVAWFTNSAILDELKKKKSDGLNVRIVTSEEYSNRYLLGNMAHEFEVIPIKKHGNHRLHDKFCIIDFEYVMHGSYNWSENAKNNNETWSTALDRDLVKKFADEFINLYSKKDSNENWLNSF